MAGLSVAGLVAVVALLANTAVDLHWRVVGTSLGFSVFSATAAAGLLALRDSHASLMLRARRPGDGTAVRVLTTVSVTTLGIDAGAGMLGILGALDDLDWEYGGRLLAALVVIALLTTALVPLRRRLDRTRGDAPPTSAGSRASSARNACAAPGARRLAPQPLTAIRAV